MRETTAAIVGFLVASIIPGATISALWPIDGTHRIGSILSTFAVAYPFSVVAVIFLGLPAFLLLRPFRPGHWWSVLAVGFLLGAMVSVIVRLPSVPNFSDFFRYGPIGALAAYVFWLIWKRHAGRKLENDC